MGYTTKFTGRFTIEPMLTMDQFSTLKGLCGGEAAEGPGGYCQWIPTDDGKGLEWDGNEKFRDYAAWLEHITKKLKGWGLTISGSVEWSGESRDDRGTLSVIDGKVIAEQSGPFKVEKRPVLTARNAFNAILALGRHDEIDDAKRIARAAIEAIL